MIVLKLTANKYFYMKIINCKSPRVTINPDIGSQGPGPVPSSDPGSQRVWTRPNLG